MALALLLRCSGVFAPNMVKSTESLNSCDMDTFHTSNIFTEVNRVKAFEREAGCCHRQFGCSPAPAERAFDLFCQASRDQITFTENGPDFYYASMQPRPGNGEETNPYLM